MIRKSCVVECDMDFDDAMEVYIGSTGELYFDTDDGASGENTSIELSDKEKVKKVAEVLMTWLKENSHE